MIENLATTTVLPEPAREAGDRPAAEEGASFGALLAGLVTPAVGAEGGATAAAAPQTGAGQAPSPMAAPGPMVAPGKRPGPGALPAGAAVTLAGSATAPAGSDVGGAATSGAGASAAPPLASDAAARPLTGVLASLPSGGSQLPLAGGAAVTPAGSATAPAGSDVGGAATSGAGASAAAMLALASAAGSLAVETGPDTPEGRRAGSPLAGRAVGSTAAIATELAGGAPAMAAMPSAARSSGGPLRPARASSAASGQARFGYPDRLDAEHPGRPSPAGERKGHPAAAVGVGGKHPALSPPLPTAGPSAPAGFALPPDPQPRPDLLPPALAAEFPLDGIRSDLNALPHSGAGLPAASPPSPPPVRSMPIAQLGLFVVRAASQQLSHLVVRLEPAALGRVEISLRFKDDGRVTASFRAQQGDALQMLRAEAPAFARLFTEHGIELAAGGLDFGMMQGEAGRHDDRPTPVRTVHAAPEVSTVVAEAGRSSSSLRLGLFDLTV